MKNYFIILLVPQLFDKLLLNTFSNIIYHFGAGELLLGGG